jgi:hypothetical protein
MLVLVLCPAVSAGSVKFSPGWSVTAVRHFPVDLKGARGVATAYEYAKIGKSFLPVRSKLYLLEHGAESALAEAVFDGRIDRVELSPTQDRVLASVTEANGSRRVMLLDSALGVLWSSLDNRHFQFSGDGECVALASRGVLGRHGGDFQVVSKDGDPVHDKTFGDYPDSLAALTCSTAIVASKGTAVAIDMSSSEVLWSVKVSADQRQILGLEWLRPDWMRVDLGRGVWVLVDTNSGRVEYIHEPTQLAAENSEFSRDDFLRMKPRVVGTESAPELQITDGVHRGISWGSVQAPAASTLNLSGNARSLNIGEHVRKTSGAYRLTATTKQVTIETF